jgi:hypothetical protein
LCRHDNIKCFMWFTLHPQNSAAQRHIRLLKNEIIKWKNM